MFMLGRSFRRGFPGPWCTRCELRPAYRLSNIDSSVGKQARKLRLHRVPGGIGCNAVTLRNGFKIAADPFEDPSNDSTDRVDDRPVRTVVACGSAEVRLCRDGGFGFDAQRPVKQQIQRF